MAKASDLAAEIMSLIPPSRRALSWWQTIDKKHEAMLKVVADGYREGKYGPSKQRAAKAIAAWLQKEGIATVGKQGVLNWLNQLTP